MYRLYRTGASQDWASVTTENYTSARFSRRGYNDALAITQDNGDKK